MKEQTTPEMVKVLRRDRKGFIDFILKVEAKINEGYEIIGSDLYAPKVYPYMAFFRKKGSGDVVVEAVVEGADVEAKEEVSDPLVALEAITGKEELLAFAAQNNIVVPEDAKVPLAIKKAIRKALSAS